MRASCLRFTDIVLIQVRDGSERGGETQDQSRDEMMEYLSVPQVLNPLHLASKNRVCSEHGHSQGQSVQHCDYFFVWFWFL